MINKIENFIGDQYINDINSIVLGNDFPWFLLNTATPSDEKTDIKDINGNSFINAPIHRHWFYLNGSVNSNNCNLIKPVLDQISKYLDKEIHLNSSTMNLLLPNEKLLNRYGLPHIDVNYSSEQYKNYNTYTGLYYLNDADGDTVLYNEIYENKIPESFTLNKKVSPKADTFLLWESNRYHSSPAGSSTIRAVLNINFLVKK